MGGRAPQQRRDEAERHGERQDDPRNAVSRSVRLRHRLLRVFRLRRRTRGQKTMARHQKRPRAWCYGHVLQQPRDSNNNEGNRNDGAGQGIGVKDLEPNHVAHPEQC
jgi:hypothetical protein